MKRKEKKLNLTKEMVRELTRAEVVDVLGGLTTFVSCTGSCESQCFSCGLDCY